MRPQRHASQAEGAGAAPHLGGPTIMTAVVHETALAPEPRLYDIPDLCRILRLSRSVIYEQIRAGRLRTVKEGRSRRASERAVRDYIALLEKEAETQR